MTTRERKLKSALDHLLSGYGPEFLHSDPLRFPKRYTDPRDAEVVALLSALFAYGNVKAMGAFLESLFARLGPRPAGAIRAGIPGGAFPGYRFQTGADAGALLRGLGLLLADYGAVEACFGAAPGDEKVRLEHLARELRLRCGPPTRGLRHLLPLPSSGSACKRWWLFLRWVCRPADGLDLGIWGCVRPADLLLPVDTHVARMARGLGLTARSTADWKFAQEATASLRRLCPEDPVRYDFALARPGILGKCPCQPGDPHSARCPLRALCNRNGRRRRGHSTSGDEVSE